MSYYAYTPITDDPVVLDLTGCNDLGDLHQRIRKTFGFPGYYGENWDAMWDCLTDVFLWESDRRAIHIKGYNTMSNELQNYCQTMKEILFRLQQRSPGVIISYL